MEIRKLLIAGLVTLTLFGGAVSTGCVGTNDGEQGIEFIEEMSEADWARRQLILSLGVSVGANRLVEAGVVSQTDLELAAATLEIVRDQELIAGATSLITPALENAGVTNAEIQLLLLVVEQELLRRGALQWLDENGQVALSPRTRELLTTIANSLRTATSMTTTEISEATSLLEA